jgi:outer membrane protein assembly factor BamB
LNIIEIQPVLESIIKPSRDRFLIFSLYDGSLLEEIQIPILPFVMENGGGPHEMPDGSFIIKLRNNDRTVFARYSVPDNESIRELPPDPGNSFNSYGPVFVDDKYLIIGARNSLICADIDTGVKVWESYEATYNIPLGVTPDGNIFSEGAIDSKYHIILTDPDGNFLWSYELDWAGLNKDRVIYNDGSILVGDRTSLVLLNPAGTLNWELMFEDLANEIPELSFDGSNDTIYDCKLYPTPDDRIVCGFSTSTSVAYNGYLVILGPAEQD